MEKKATAWYMSACDQYGNPTGKKVNITDVVLDTAAEEKFDAESSEQEMAAAAVTESEYGVEGEYLKGVYWTE